MISQRWKASNHQVRWNSAPAKCLSSHRILAKPSKGRSVSSMSDTVRRKKFAEEIYGNFWTLHANWNRIHLRCPMVEICTHPNRWYFRTKLVRRESTFELSGKSKKSGKKKKFVNFRTNFKNLKLNVISSQTSGSFLHGVMSNTLAMVTTS